MKGSTKYLMGLASVAGLGFAISLPALAQTATPDQTTAPSGVVDRPTAGESGRPGMSGTPGNGMPGMGMPGMSQPGMGMDTMSFPSSTSSMSLGEVVGGTRSFSLLNALVRVAAIKEPGLLSRLTGSGKYTVFAPTDRAFAALPPGAVHALVQPQNRDLLVQLLAYHVVRGEVSAANMGTTNIGRELMANRPPSGNLNPNENSAAVDRSQVIEPNETGANRNSGSVGTQSGMGNSSSTTPSTGMGQSGQAQAGLPPSGELRPNENSARTDRSQVIEPNQTASNNGSGTRTGMSSPGGMSTPGGMSMGSGSSMGSMSMMAASDIQASNGIIHAINRVIIPASLQAQLQAAIAADMAPTATPRR